VVSQIWELTTDNENGDILAL